MDSKRGRIKFAIWGRPEVTPDGNNMAVNLFGYFGWISNWQKALKKTEYFEMFSALLAAVVALNRSGISRLPPKMTFVSLRLRKFPSKARGNIFSNVNKLEVHTSNFGSIYFHFLHKQKSVIKNSITQFCWKYLPWRNCIKNASKVLMFLILRRKYLNIFDHWRRQIWEDAGF